MPAPGPRKVVTELVVQIRVMPGPIVGTPGGVELAILEFHLRQTVQSVVPGEETAGIPTGRLGIDALRGRRNGVPVNAKANFVEHGGRNRFAQFDYRSPRWVGEDVADCRVGVTTPERGEAALRHLVVDVASHQVEL